MKSRIFGLIIAPFILFMIVFYVYTIYDMENHFSIQENYWKHKHAGDEHSAYSETNWKMWAHAFRIIMLILVFYFSAIEFMQMVYDGIKAYVSSI
jgi:hypothetical protein